MGYNDIITLSVGSGGKATNDFIGSMIMRHIGNDVVRGMTDAGRVHMASGHIAFTTDSFVVKPEFFPGGNIGKLAVCGTVNDLAVSGAIPRWLSLGLIIPEGYLVSDLERVLASIGETAKSAGVQIACGDTKVVERGALDGLVINTSGIGDTVKDQNDFAAIKPGDKLIISSDIARHGVSILLARGELGFAGDVESDCACLNGMLADVLDLNVKFCRDATRGGVAAVLNEIATAAGVGFMLTETAIPIRENVQYLCEMLGFDPLSVANEGVAVLVVAPEDADEALARLRRHATGTAAAIAGTVTEGGRVILETSIGGKRNVDMPMGELLPRIC